MGNIEKVLAFNRQFVASKAYKTHLTDKYPDKKLAVLSCMDTRLSVLLQEALGLRNGDAKIIKNAGAVIPSPWDSAMRSLIVAVYELGVNEIMVVAHTSCGACHMSFGHFKEEMLKRGIPEAELDRDDVDLDAWLEGFHDTEASVRNTVEAIVNHPLIPADVTVRGFIIDPATGGLNEVNVNNQKHMDQKFCQSCGMPLTDEVLGTNADGSKNEDYCIYCYADGKFLQDCTMDEMIEHCAQFVDEVNKNLPQPITREQYIEQMKQYFPHLKRWSKA